MSPPCNGSEIIDVAKQQCRRGYQRGRATVHEDIPWTSFRAREKTARKTPVLRISRFFSNPAQNNEHYGNLVAYIDDQEHRSALLRAALISGAHRCLAP
jgi:hypothetical protein